MAARFTHHDRMPRSFAAVTFVAPEVAALDRSFAIALQARLDAKTKPVGALGRIEALALQLGLIQGSLNPELRHPHLLVCAGDHGAARAGISAYPQEVTWQMVENFLAGGAAINVFATRAGLRLLVADAGVNHDFGVRPGLVDAKQGHGTASYLDGAAMSPEACAAAMHAGADIVAGMDAQGCNVVGFGEMGIGNTAAAALITHCLTGVPLADCVGPGTGLDAAGVARKLALLQQALECWRAAGGNPADAPALDVLARFGGYEIAMLAGAMLAAAARRMVLLVDGFIVTAAMLVAVKLQAAVRDYCVFAHRSGEPGHALQLAYLHAEPLLDLGLRLGEGTGAALAWPLLDAAAAMLRDMASFDSAQVSGAIR